MIDKIEANKIAGAVLSSLLVIFGMATVIDIFYPSGEIHGPAKSIQVTSAPVEETKAAGPAKEAVPEQPINVLLAAANPSSGEQAAKKCAACHTFKEGGANGVGPNLYNIVGKDVAKGAGFAYSPALSGKGGSWSYELLSCYIKDPKGCVPGNKMAFAGIKKETERADLIAYLRSLSASPQPLPAK